jgi:short-subunit dehydrogenase
MKAVIVGASSGIGRDIAKALSKSGCELILVARREDRLEELKSELDTHVEIITADISQTDVCIDLHEKIKNQNIDILVNNAGIGIFGDFDKTDLESELSLIDTNIKATHILTKLFLRDFVARDYGYILNVSSASSFVPGPRMASYYASKAYIMRLTLAVFEELRRRNSNVRVSVLCPGPTCTEFDMKAGSLFNLPYSNSERIAESAVKNLKKMKMMSIPEKLMKAAKFATRLLSDKLILKISYCLIRPNENADYNDL